MSTNQRVFVTCEEIRKLAAEVDTNG